MRPVAAVVAAVLGLTLLAGPAQAGPSHPGDFTGYAFDTCDAPSQRKMDDWRRASPYAGVGIYIAGVNRACKEQRHLTRRWVAEQERKGWRLLPLVVGRQASCASEHRYGPRRISPSSAGDHAEARTQGRAAAEGAVRAARDLGIARGSVLWYDLEDFDADDRACRLSALAFVSAWTRTLHRLDHRSGVYSSVSSGIAMLDDARREQPGRDDLPDYVWIAEWDGEDTVHSPSLPAEGWWPHRRVRQYRGPHTESHAGSRINVDSNYLSTGRGTVGGTADGMAGGPCRVPVDFPSYRRLERGDRGPRVAAAQCHLAAERHYRGRLHGRFDRRTERAVRSFQREQSGLATSGVVTAGTWTSLLSQGGTPLLKYGEGGPAVRRLQRSLNAATDAELVVDGVFADEEHRAVLGYQRLSGAEATGVVTSATWHRLRHGRVVGPLATPAEAGLARLLDLLVRAPFGSDPRPD